MAKRKSNAFPQIPVERLEDGRMLFLSLAVDNRGEVWLNAKVHADGCFTGGIPLNLLAEGASFETIVQRVSKMRFTYGDVATAVKLVLERRSAILKAAE